MKKILILYYTQTGQIETILKNMFQDINEIETDYVRIHADPEYPFPWKSEDFFDVFPESRNGISCTLKHLKINKKKKYDLIVFGLQVWYLEPSIPTASFLKSEYAYILNNTPVITVYGVRNMWINAHNTVKDLIHKKGGILIGNIVLADKHNNLISVLTIIRWLLHGKKEAGKILPAAGVSESDIKNTGKFGKSIADHLNRENLINVQSDLENKGAVQVKYHIMKTELAGSKIFKIWADLILRKSKGNKIIKKRLSKIFKFYLLFVIYIVSPISSMIFRAIRLIFPKKTKKQIAKHVSLA